MVYLQVLRQGYALSTVMSYFSDLKNLQRRYTNGLALHVLTQTFGRCKMLMTVFKKEMPVLRQKKRPWRPDYFHHVAIGMGWVDYPWVGLPKGGTRSPSHRHRVVWTGMVFMFEHLLRLGEVVDTFVVRQAARRPWTLANVSFWAGDREIGWDLDGAPCREDRCSCTHALVDVTPSKTDAAGEKFDPLVCPFPRELDVLEACGGAVAQASRAGMFATGVLLWDLMERNPVARCYKDSVPLLRSTAAGPPTLVAQLHQNEFVEAFHFFCRSATPVVPVHLDGKALGGHCMRVAGCNAAADLGATITDIANKGRWGAFAFAAARGYDYLRTNRQGIEHLTMRMVVALATLPAAVASGDSELVAWRAGVWFALACVALGGALVAIGLVVGLSAARAPAVQEALTPAQTAVPGTTETAPLVDPEARQDRPREEAPAGGTVLDPFGTNFKREPVSRAQRLEEYHARMLALRQRAARPVSRRPHHSGECV